MLWSAYKAPFLLGVASFILITASIVLLVKAATPAAPIRFSDGSNVFGSSEYSKSAVSKGLAVDISGAVALPGLYYLPVGSRVEEALLAAGGLTADADSVWAGKNINRAMKVTDGMKLYIPLEIETSHNGDSVRRVVNTSHNLDAVVATPGTSSQNGVLVSINSASQSELESLSGVGPVTAQKIMMNRPYGAIEDLVTKKAVGQSLFEKIRLQISL